MGTAATLHLRFEGKLHGKVLPNNQKWRNTSEETEKSRADVNGVNCLKQALVGGFLDARQKNPLLQKNERRTRQIRMHPFVGRSTKAVAAMRMKKSVGHGCSKVNAIMNR
jgi:hypothetical protein